MRPTRKGKRFALSNIFNILSGVFVPLAGFLVKRLGLIPAERILAVWIDRV